ncbi:MAG: hypothetical protein M9924_21905 [Rhizobiaceae bacterium]|nr:hypothetical protein [Rhizobiaceae bacterium]
MPNQTTGYLIDPTAGVLSYVTIHDPADRFGHDTRSQMLLRLNAKGLDVLPVELDGAAHLVWHDAHCFEGYTSGLFQIDKLPFLAGRAVIFADDGKSPEDANATPFGLTPTIAAQDLAARITGYRPVIIPRMRDGSPAGFDLALERSTLTVAAS